MNYLDDERDLDTSVEMVSRLIEGAEYVYLKKLSLNDWQWTQDEKKHQNGPYIPKEDRDSGFFPPLIAKFRPNGGAEIREVYFPISWPRLSIAVAQEARLVNYRSKKEETHLTGVPSTEFTGLNPASLILVVRTKDLRFCAMTIDSQSTACEYIVDLFDLQPEFVSGVFRLSDLRQSAEQKLFAFINEAIYAFRANRLHILAGQHGIVPQPRALAEIARRQYISEKRLSGLNPFSLKSPGDAIMQISRGVEYDLYKDYELRRRSLELAVLLLGSGPREMSVEQALINVISEYRSIDKILLSAAQTRKSRAGASFEYHIEQMLIDGAIPHEVQVVIAAKKRPDFILPGLRTYMDPLRSREAALVLSAKTTLRERWKQVTGEIRNCELFLATVDENIADNAIRDMRAQGITLVVPESLKKSDTTVYEPHDNVISFKSFFEDEIRTRRLPIWRGM